MIDFPSRTKVNRRIPKEAFYKHLPLRAALKEKFVSDVERIEVEHSLTKDNLNLEVDSEVKEILLLGVQLKKENFEGKILEAIARQNPHHLIFLLRYKEKGELAAYHTKLYQTAWTTVDALELSLSGPNLKEIWEDLVRQIALHEETAKKETSLSLDEALKRQEDIERLQKLIKKTEGATWKEVQPKKKFALYTKLENYKKELEEILNGKV